MLLLSVTLLCAAIHSEIMYGMWNESTENIFKRACKEIWFCKRSSAWKKRSSLVEPKCKKRNEGGIQFHKLTLKEFFPKTEVALDRITFFRKCPTQKQRQETEFMKFMKFHTVQHCIVYSTSDGDTVCKRLPIYNAIMLVMMHTSSCSDVEIYNSTKWLISSDYKKSFIDFGIMFENVLWDVDINISFENYYTDSFTSLFTDNGGLHAYDYLHLEDLRLHLYKNTTEPVSEIENCFCDVLFNDNYCCANIQSESNSSVGCLALFSLPLKKFFQDQDHGFIIFYRDHLFHHVCFCNLWVIPLQSHYSNITLMTTDLFDFDWLGHKTSRLIWFEYVMNSNPCKYHTHSLLILDVCLNETELTFCGYDIQPLVTLAVCLNDTELAFCGYDIQLPMTLDACLNDTELTFCGYDIQPLVTLGACLNDTELSFCGYDIQPLVTLGACFNDTELAICGYDIQLLVTLGACINDTELTFYGYDIQPLVTFGAIFNDTELAFCGYDIQLLVSLGACLNDTELTFLLHILFQQMTYFPTVYLCEFSKKEKGSCTSLCPVLLLLNGNFTTIRRYCISAKSFLYKSIITIEFSTTISFSRLDKKDYILESIFILPFLRNITFTSNVKNNSSMSKGELMDRLFWYIVYNIQHRYMILSNNANTDELLQLGYQISKTSCDTVIKVDILKIDCPNSRRDDKSCIDYSVLVISNYFSCADVIFCGKLSVNHRLDFTVFLMIQNAYIIECWQFHLGKHRVTDWTESFDLISGLSENIKCFEKTLPVNYFDKLTTLQNNCIIRSKPNFFFKLYEENEGLHQFCKFNEFMYTVNKVALKTGEHFCVEVSTSAHLEYNVTSKCRVKLSKRPLMTFGNFSQKRDKLYRFRLGEMINLYPHFVWRRSDILFKCVFLDDSHQLVDVANSSMLYKYNMHGMKRPKSNFNNTDKPPVLLHNSFLQEMYSKIAIGYKLPRKRNVKKRDFSFPVFESSDFTAFHGHNKMVFENRTRTGHYSGSDCDNTIRPKLNYRSVSLEQNVSLSSNSTSNLFMSEETARNYFIDILIPVLVILSLKCKHKRQTLATLLDYAKDHHLQSVFQSTKSSSHCVTGSCEEFDNIRDVGYLDHTVHMTIIVEVVFEAIILGYFWRLNFVTCFNKTYKRSRTSLKLLSKRNFKIQIASLAIHIFIQYNSPTNGISELPVQQSNIVQYSRHENTCGEICKERNTCHSDEDTSKDSLALTTYPSLPLSETEEGTNEEYSLKSETANSVNARVVKYDSFLSSKTLRNVKKYESNLVCNCDDCMSQKTDSELTSLKFTDDYDIDHTYVKHQQRLSNDDREDNETSLKTIGSYSVHEYLDFPLSEDIYDLNDLNISPREGSKTKESINMKALSSGKVCKEMEKTVLCRLKSTEVFSTNKVCEIDHMYKFERPRLDLGKCSDSLDTLSSYDSNKMESKGNNSVVLSSLRSLPTSSGFENVACYHCCIDSKQSTSKQFHTPIEETCAISTASKIVTSSSLYKETNCSKTTTIGHVAYIAQGVRRFMKKYRKKQRRKLLRRIRQCTSRIKDIKVDKIICNPVFAKDASSNTADQRQVSLPQPESTPAHDIQNNTAGNLFFVYQLPDYESSLGTLSSIFNDISIQSLNGNDGYQYEWIRLASFTNFSSETVHATRLARSGWYSTGNGDQTACFSCHRIHANWTRNDDPSGHSLHDPDCRFMLQISNNRPIPRESTIHRDLSSESFVTENNTRDHTQRINQQTNSENTTVLSENSSSQNTLSLTNIVNEGRSEIHNTSQTIVAQAAASEGTRETQLEALMRDPMGINFDRPKYSSYAILAVRISSYSDWPASMTQTPRDMALAGFFYAGYGDYTRCFFCGGGLRNWEAGDDPWVEHARWFSKCAFVRQNRGQQFIDLVLRRAAEMEHQQTESQCDEATESKKAKEAKIMKSAAVRSIKDMGYSEEKIKEAIDTIKSRLPKGKHKVSAHEILEVLFELADNRSIAETRQSEPTPQQTEPTTGSRSNEHQSSTNLTANTNGEGGATAAVNNLTLNDLETLQRENSSLKDQIICKICMEKNVSIAFLPCGHLACCADCAPAMRKCPICREFVRGTVKTYLV